MAGRGSPRRIQPVGWTLDREWLRGLDPVYQLHFPGRWRRELLSLLKQYRNRRGRGTRGNPRRDGGKNEPRIPIASLNQALGLRFPGIITVLRNASQGTTGEGDKPWLIADAPIPGELLKPVIRAWLKVIGDRQKIPWTPLSNLIRSWEPEWTTLALLPDFQCEKNGTVKLDGHYFRIVPYLLARRIQTLPGGLIMGKKQEPLRFCIIPKPTLPWERAELMTYPPRRHAGRNWSLVMRWEVHTIPGQPEPEVYAFLSVRRWVNKRLNPHRNKYSVYIRHADLQAGGYSIHPGAGETAAVAQLRVRRREKETVAFWDPGDTMSLLSELDLDGTLPAPGKLAADPAMQSGAADGEPWIGIPAHTGRRDKALIKGGVTTYDYRHLFEQINEQFEMLKPLPDSPMETAVSRAWPSRFTSLRNMKQLKQRDGHCESFRKSVGDEGTILYIGENDEISKAVASSWEELFQISRLPGIRLGTASLGVLSGRLEYDAASGNIDNALRERAAEIAEKMRASAFHRPLGAIVELEDYRNRGWDNDPKQAIRRGMADAGFATQFIVPESKNIKHRAENAVLDLARTLGYMKTAGEIPFAAESRFLAGGGAPLKIIGLSTFYKPQERKRFLPAAVEWEINSHEVRVNIPSCPSTPDGRWTRYHQAAVKLAARPGDEWFTRGEKFQRPLLQWLAHLIHEATSDNKVVLIVDAMTCRSWWRWLQNPSFRRNRIEIYPGEAISPVIGARLRVIRIRRRPEVPAWFVSHPVGQGLTKGLFPAGPGRWLSIQQKASTAQVSHKFHRIDAPTRTIWTPRAVEIIPAGARSTFPGLGPKIDQLAETEAAAAAEAAPLDGLYGDTAELEALELAALAHHIRCAAPHFDEALGLPAPIFLARQLREYGCGDRAQEDKGGQGAKSGTKLSRRLR